MELFGWSVTRRRPRREKSYPVPVGSGGWWPIWPNVQEPSTGAWQLNASTNTETIVAHHTVFACVRRIASDISKMPLRLVRETQDPGIWVEADSPAFSPVLRKPNEWQTSIQFIEWWLTSKLIHGNTYVLKRRDGRGVVTAHYVLNPNMVRVLTAPDGSVFYAVSPDPLTTLLESQIIPAREIMHDRMIPLYHPLVGVSPIHACAMAAIQGLQIQANSTRFFTNGSRPGGVLSAPGAIAQATADRIKTAWETNFSGDNYGKVAVLGEGLTYTPMTVNAKDAELVEQARLTAETICSAFGVPAYMVGVGPLPTFNNIEALNQQYYQQCLQVLIEELELVLDEGLGLTERINGVRYGTEFDLDALLRMDTAALIKAEADAIGSGIKKPNESRARLNLPPVEGGDTPYLQIQNYSLAALNRRDQTETPVTSGMAPTAPADTPADTETDAEERALHLWRTKHQALVEAA